MMADNAVDFRCFICNLPDIPVTEGISVFDKNAVLESGLKLSEAVSQILGREIDPLVSNTSVICKKCHKTCEEYDEINKRLSSLKSKMANQFRKTMPVSNVNLCRDSSTDLTDTLVKIEFDEIAQSQSTKKEMKKIVLSKSKMTPLPASYGQNCVFVNTNKTKHSNKNKPLAVLSPTKLPTTTSAAIVKQNPPLIMTKSINTVTNKSPGHLFMVNTSSETPVATTNKPGNITLTDSSNRIQKTSIKTHQLKTTFNVANSPKGKCLQLSTKATESSKPMAATSRQLVKPRQVENEYVISGVEVLNDDGDDTDTILMDEDGSILQVLRGDQRNLLSHVNRISLVLTQESEESDSHNSRELRMSVDEEDAAATINGATEQIEHNTGPGSNEIQEKHTDEKLQQKSYPCKICSKKYVSKNLLEEHMSVHTGTRAFCCTVCQKNFANKYSFHAHLKTHCERPRPFTCDKCDKTFLSLQHMLQHEKVHSGVKEFTCNVCKKAFRTQHNLDIHRVVHSDSKPYVCGVCEKGFARKAEIRDHLRTHTGERPYACDICGQRFAQSSNMVSHRRTTHFDDRRYSCTQCDKRFKRRRLLEYHICSVHTGERPFKCKICEATFVYPEHYKKHALTHSGTKPYSCEVCDRRFNSRDNRNAHRFTHSDKKPYECLVCGVGYMRKPQLYAHMTAQGHLADMIVVNQARFSEQTGTVAVMERLYSAEQSGKASDESVQTSAVEFDTNISDIFPEKNVTEKRANGSIKSERRDNVNADGNVTAMEETVLTLTEDPEVTSQDLLNSAAVERLLLQGSEVITTDEEGNVMRLVQIELPGGESGWVALDADVSVHTAS